MSSPSELSSFAARLRGIILAFNRTTELPAFDQLALKLFALQFEHNGSYRRICEARGVTRPENVGHWTVIPAVPTSAFKELALSCLPAAERTAVFHSSGTTEQRPSRHFHNAESLALYEASLLVWFNSHFHLEIGHWPLAILTPPPKQAPHSSLVHMFEVIRRKSGSGESAFLGKVAKDGAWTVEPETAVEVLRKASATGQPLLLLGTAFSFVHLLDHLADRRLRFELPPGSSVLETGGYKGRSRSLPKAELHDLIAQCLGILPGRIVCEYGMSELSSQAYDMAIGEHHAESPGFGSSTVSFPLTPALSLGERGNFIPPRDTPEPFDFAAMWAKELPLAVGEGRGEGKRIDLSSGAATPPTSKGNQDRTFHFPPWARAQVISPETGCEVQDGETGLIRVIDLANVYSVLAIQTEDLGIRRGDGFVLVGRAVEAEPRGCSLMAV